MCIAMREESTNTADLTQSLCPLCSHGLSKPLFFMGCLQAQGNLWSDADQTSWAGGHLPRVSSAPSLPLQLTRHRFHLPLGQPGCAALDGRRR